MQNQILRYAFMKLTRELDARFENLLLTGRVAKWYSEVGNEATTVAAGLSLQRGDVLCTLHRDLGAILAYYLDPARTFPGMGFAAGPDEARPEPELLLYRLACQLLGRRDGFSQGVERSFHYAYREPEAGLHHIGMISHLGSMIPVAAGCAFALRHGGTDRVAINFIGDGGTSTGDFHEGLNMAAVWKLPLVLVVENNQYAFSTPTSLQFACNSLADRALGYGIKGVSADGNDPDAMSDVFEEAVLRARLGEGPTLVEARLGRMRGHSEGDDSLKVVPPAELSRYLAEDPVPNYGRKLTEGGVLRDELRAQLDTHIVGLVEVALSAALDSPTAEPATAMRPVFAVTTDPPQGERESEPPSGRRKEEDSAPITYIEAIHQALTEEMERDETVVLMGQDIGVFEGAFRATKGMYERWPDRVLDTPIAESGTMGVAEGAAILGYRPVVEMQFADFVSCGFNQIVNVAAKMFYRWEIPCPIVVRLPSGGGVGAGPFHSQNPEGWFAHTGGLKVVCPATVEDAKGLLKAAIRDPNPVIFCENKFLYRRIKASLSSEGSVLPLGKAAVRREGSDITLVGYGASLWTCLEVADKLAAEGVSAEVIDLRSLVPLDEETILASVAKTSRVVVAHEALLTGGFGGEVAARIADAGFAWLDAPVRRVAYPDRPAPYVKALEAVLLPGVDKVLAAARETLAY
ncbi:MAG: dehydrogenase E1 component subunit alpha/beta [Thermoanaerobaculia bacterium]|nr:dehydrogenase E1 component subunit alpha/beta [Thermoanaerobaculia bacterium]